MEDQDQKLLNWDPMKGNFRIFFSPCFQGHEKISFTKYNVSYKTWLKKKGVDRKDCAWPALFIAEYLAYRPYYYG